MRCKEAKARIKRLEKENHKLRSRVVRASEDRTYDFNLLEIVVRPKNASYIQEYMINADLRVLGCDDLKVPTIGTSRIISMAAIHLLKDNRQNFIKHIGEIMAAEVLRYADKEIA